jgi:hypothetical protein
MKFYVNKKCRVKCSGYFLDGTVVDETSEGITLKTSWQMVSFLKWNRIKDIKVLQE